MEQCLEQQQQKKSGTIVARRISLDNKQTPSTCIREWFVCGWHMTVLFVCLLFFGVFFFFFFATWKLYDFACAALVLFRSRLHRRTHTSEWERSVWSKVSLNFTKTVWLESLTACLTCSQIPYTVCDSLTTLFVPSWAERRETDGSCLPVLILLLGIKSYCISRMELTFTCMCYYFIMFFGLFDLFLKHMAFRFAQLQFYFQFVLPASWTEGWREMGWLDGWALLHFIQLLIIVLHCRLIFMHSLFLFSFFFWISASLGNVWMP